jgi:hypothetical protein
MRTEAARRETRGTPQAGVSNGSGPARALLADGRLHLQHGPIDLVIGADGAAQEVTRAYDQAAACFAGVLGELVRELPLLKQPLGPTPPDVSGPVARRMVQAVWPYRERFITPMAAVAGAGAAFVLEHLLAGRELRRAYVNNGGDLALWLAARETLTLGVISRLDVARVERRVAIDCASRVRGVATSGWAGRSFSLGIADSVTVFAAGAAEADAAATMVANAVNVEHAGIRRVPARLLEPDSDLGDLPVTVGVDIREPDILGAALDAGVREAERWVAAGTLLGAVLFLGGQCREAGWTGGRAACHSGAQPPR